MEVIVFDRFADTQNWGHGCPPLPLRTVTIGPVCPRCGGPRGTPRLTRQCEDGEHYDVHTWANPCGHVDKYSAVLREAGVYTGDEVITNQWAGPEWMGRRQAEI